MPYTAANLVHYLVDKGFATAGSVAAGGFLVLEASRRNSNFKVLSKPGPGIFVKQLKKRDGEDLRALENEAQFYRRAACDAHFAPLAPILARSYSYDPEQSVLLLELLDHPDLDNAGALDIKVAEALGRTLARCHRVSGEGLSDDLPSIFSLGSRDEASLPGSSEANLEVLRIVRGQPRFAEALRAAEAAWEPRCLIHGDLRWSNCLWDAAGGSVRLIDWEAAAFGDPCWDTGSILQEYLRLLTRGSALETVRQAAAAFWTGYGAPAQLDRSVRFAAVRLVQTAWERALHAGELDGPAIRMLQLSLNIFEDPAAAARDLLGLSCAAEALVPGEPPGSPLPVGHRSREVGCGPAGPPYDTAELDRIAAAFELLSPRSFRFCERVFTARDEPRLTREVESCLYWHVYARRFDGSAIRATMPSRDLAPELRAANPSRERWDRAWTIQAVEESGQIVASRGAAMRHFFPGEFVTKRGAGLAPIVGGGISVYCPRETREFQAGYYHAFGETPAEHEEPYGLVRLYWNVGASGVAALLHDLATACNRFLVPFRFKCCHDAAQYPRLDAAVLYIHRRYFACVARLIERIRFDRSGPDTPLFTLTLAPGLGLAEDPETGESFGHTRCRLLAEALVRGQAIEARFREAGLDPEHPWLRPGSAAIYRL